MFFLFVSDFTSYIGLLRLYMAERSRSMKSGLVTDDNHDDDDDDDDDEDKLLPWNIISRPLVQFTPALALYDPFGVMCR